jgi:hypothetical protein
MPNTLYNQMLYELIYQLHIGVIHQQILAEHAKLRPLIYN